MGYRIAANKTQEKAGWDFPKLDPIVTDLTMKGIDLSRIGLDMSYMEDMEIPDPIEIPEPSDGGKPLYPDEGDYVRFGDDALYVAERDDRGCAQTPGHRPDETVPRRVRHGLVRSELNVRRDKPAWDEHGTAMRANIILYAYLL